MKRQNVLKRIVSLILTFIIIFGICDWSTFRVEAAPTTPSMKVLGLQKTTLFGTADDDFDNDALFRTNYSLPYAEDFSNLSQYIISFLSSLVSDRTEVDQFRKAIDDWFLSYSNEKLQDYINFVNPDIDGNRFVLYVASTAEHFDKEKDGDMHKGIIVCTVDITTNNFYYLVISANTDYNDPDTISIIPKVHDKFIVPEEINEEYDDYAGHTEKCEVLFNWDGIESYLNKCKENGYIQNIVEHYMSGSSLSNEAAFFNSFLNSLYVVSNDLDGNLVLSTRPERLTYGLEYLDGDSKGAYLDVSPFGRHSSNIGDPATIKFDADFIDWGDSSNSEGITSSGSNSVGKALVIATINACIGYTQNMPGGINESNIEALKSKISTADFHRINDVVSNTIFIYSSALIDAINKYNINDIYNKFTDNLLCDGLDFVTDCNSDEANLFMQVLHMNIISMQDSSSFNNTNIIVSNYNGKTVQLGISCDMGTPSVFSSNDTFVSEAESNGKTAMTLNQLWESIKPSWKKDYILAMYREYVNAHTLGGNSNRIKMLLEASFSGSLSYDHVGELRNYTTLQDSIIKDVNSFNVELNTGSVLQIAGYSDILAEYIIGGALFNSDESGDNSVLEMYNAGLVALISNEYSYDSTKMFFPDSIAKELSIFGSGDLNGRLIMYDAFLGRTTWEQLVAHLYRTELAFEIANSSERGEEEGYTVAQLRKAFGMSVSTEEDASTTEVPGLNWAKEEDLSSTKFDSDNGVSINMIRAIAALDKMCMFLGINRGQWSDTINAYLQFWDELPEEKRNALLSNPLIKPNNSGGSDSQFSSAEPLGKFFSIEERTMSEYWNMGFALSSTYVPMETNVYDSTAYAFLDSPVWMYDMIYKYGFYRKALYISTDNNAVNNQLMNASSGGIRVATFSDLLNYDRDIVLYVDSNFYNADEVGNITSKLDYTTIRNTAESGSTSTDLWSSLKDSLQELFDLDTATVLKTAGNNYYSNTLYSKCSRMDASADTWTKKYADLYLLDSESIRLAIDEQDEYTVQQSFAVVSAIYRSDKLFNLLLQSLNSDNAVFKSSRSVCANPAATKEDWLSVYNYYMLANLEDQMKNDAASSLDLDAPIFVDIFGNILTESGLVIIPAAANPTLVGDSWDPYTVAFPTYYYNGNMIQPKEFTNEFYEWLTGTPMKADGSFEIMTSEKVKKECGGGYFALDSNGFTLRSGVIQSYDISALINFEQLQKNAQNIKQLFYNRAYYDKTKDLYAKKGRVLVNMVTEVLRGAPIENINYAYEGLDGNTSIGKYGVYMAYKLEELTSSFLGEAGTAGNSMVTMPNLAFIDGIEYIVLYVFKVMFALLIVGLALNLYFDAVQNKIGFASAGKFIFTCVALLASMTLIPDLISWSYYKANKELLKDEVGYIMMLDYSKEFNGSEIGITKVSTPESGTEFYIKLNDVSLDWWSVIYPVLFTNTYDTVTDLFKEQLEGDLMAAQDNVILKADGLYMDTMNIFESTTLQYQPSTKTFVNYNYAGDSNVTSFVIPYYVILDQIISNINSYNNSQLIDSYSYSIGSNGHICTYGLVAPYFSSTAFLEEGYDILGLHYIHQGVGDISGEAPYSVVFSKSDIERMSMSEWYSHYTGAITNSKIENLYTYARDWVAKNREMMGKVPDEVFLKVFAMQMAVEYNNIFGVADGNSIEIMNVDTRDIMRFMVGDKANVYKYYSYSFSRYVYEEAGTLGVIVAGAFLVVLWLTSFIKPVLMVVILGLFIINIIGRKILFRKDSKCVEGYLIGCACLCLCNYAYSGMLKISIMVADYGMGAIASLGLGIVVQVLYAVALVTIAGIEIKDWKNNGFYEYANQGSVLVSHMTHTGNMIVNRLSGRKNSGYRSAVRSNQRGADYYNEMLERDNKHYDRAAGNIQQIDYDSEVSTF